MLQTVTKEAAIAEDHVPALHRLHNAFVEAAEVADHVPALQLMQVALVVAPGVDEYFPAMHAIHVLIAPAPLVADQVPALQLRHDVIVAAANADDHDPALQLIQTDELLAPLVEDHVPATQDEHTVAPEEIEYVPGLQVLQLVIAFDATTVENVPALQFVHNDDAKDDQEPALQFRQALADVAPLVGEYIPAEHDIQAVAPAVPVV